LEHRLLLFANAFCSLESPDAELLIGPLAGGRSSLVAAESTSTQALSSARRDSSVFYGPLQSSPRGLVVEGQSQDVRPITTAADLPFEPAKQSLIMPQDALLFTPAAGQAPADLVIDPVVVRESFVDIQLDVLGSATAPAQTVDLNLFEDTRFTAIYDRTETNVLGSHAWIGHVDGVEFSQVVLVVTDGIMAGSVTMPGANYQVRPLGGSQHVIEEIDQSRFPDELEPIAVPVEADEPSLIGQNLMADEPPAGDDPATEITVLVAYSPEARAAAGGTAQIQAVIAQAVVETNQSYANSGITQRVTLVHTMETTAGDSVNNFSTDLSALQNLGDGKFNNVDAARETYYADEVALIIEDTQYCGLGYLNSTAATAFSVTYRGCATGYYSFGHEMGHNMGARHDWYVDATSGYNHGFVNVADSWRTVMAYNNLASDQGGNATRLPYWSNPEVTYGSPPDPMGVVSTGPVNCVAGNLSPNPSTCAADNRLRLNERAYTVANFRDSPDTGINLRGTAFDVTPEPLLRGDSFTATINIQNNGADASISYDVAFYVSTNNIISTGDFLLGTLTMPSLAVC
jgi:hypothetical protein